MKPAVGVDTLSPLAGAGSPLTRPGSNALLGTLAVACGIAVVVPFPAVRYLVVGLLWVIFFASYIQAPERTLLVFVVLFPAVKLLPPGAAILPGLNFETVVIPMLMAAVLLSHDDRDATRPANAVLPPVAFYVGLLVLSAVLSLSSGTAMEHSWQRGWYKLGAERVFSTLKNTIFFVFLAPIAFRLVWTTEQLRRLVYLIAWVSLLTSAFSIWMLWDKIVAGEVGGFDRAESFLIPQPNLFGGFVAMMFLMLAPLLLVRGLHLGQRLFLGLAVAVTATALLYSFSRGAWLAAIAGLACLGVLRGSRMAIVLLVLGLSASLWVPQGVIERVRFTFDQPQTATFDEGVQLENSAKTRADQWAALPGYLKDAPLLGHGYMSFGRLWGKIALSGAAVAPHSSIVELGVEEGLLGLAAYGWLILTLAWSAWLVRGRTKDPFTEALASGFLAAVVSLVLLDASGTRFKTSAVMAFIWLLGGALARLGADLDDAADAEARPDSCAASEG